MGSATKLRSGAMLLDGGTVLQRCNRRRVQSPAEFFIESRVRPIFDMIVQATLQVEAAAGGRAHRAQREAALVIGIDQFIGDRRLVDQDAQPAKRVDAFVTPENILRDALAANAMEAVAAGNEVALDLLYRSAMAVAHAAAVRLVLVQADIGRLVHRLPAGRGAPIHQVARDLGLAVDHHALADQILEIDPVPLPVETQFDAAVEQAFALHARADTCLIEQVG
jgi:hypothetical protein